MGLSIDVTQVNRVSSDGNTVNEGTKTVSVGQAHIVFDKLPETKDELQSIDRSGENGKYVTMALLFAVVRNMYTICLRRLCIAEFYVERVLTFTRNLNFFLDKDKVICYLLGKR